MNILFTRRNKIGSRIIRWVTGEEVSHVAIDFGDFVAGMGFTGLTIEPTKYFYSIHEVVATREFDGNLQDVIATLDNHYPKGYDYPALIWLGLALLCQRFFGFPKTITRNPWQKKHLDFCTEFASRILGRNDGPIMTPGRLLKFF